VMIPMLNGIGLDGISQSNFWASTKNTDFEHFSFFPLQYTSSLAESQFAGAYAAEKLSNYIDNLNMLYVATTRAKTELYILSDAKKKKVTDISEPVHQILTMAPQNEKLKYFASAFENDLPEFTIGEKAQRTRQYERIVDTEIGQEYVVTSPDKLPSLRKSKMQDYSDENIRYGQLIHVIFSKIKIASDLETALDDALKYAYITLDELPEIKNTMQKILDNHVVKDWFSAKWKVRTERKFISAGGTVKVPDRVIYSERECKVIDFKTGVHRPENEKQVRDYMKLLRDSGFEQVEGWLLYTDEVKTIKIV